MVFATPAILPHPDWFKLTIKSYRVLECRQSINQCFWFFTRNGCNCEALAPFEDVNAWKFYFIRNKNNKNKTKQKMFSGLSLCGWKDWCLINLWARPYSSDWFGCMQLCCPGSVWAIFFFSFLLDAVGSIITLARTPRQQHNFPHTP